MQITLGNKLFFYTSGTLIAVLLMTFLVLERNQSQTWEEHLYSQSQAFARFATPELLKLFRGSFADQGAQNLTEVRDFLNFNPDLMQFFMMTPGGRVLFESPKSAGFGGIEQGLLATADLEERLKTAKLTIRTLLLQDGHRALDLLTPAFGPTGEQILSVRYLISYDSVDARLAEVRQYFLRIALLTVACSLILVAMVANRVTRPIKELIAGARAIAKGNLKTRIRSLRGDEIGTLAMAFNEMAESLSLNRMELTSKNTALTAANEELQQMQQNLVRAERLAAIGQLAAGVSHEIDNPVGIILGYAQLLLEDLEDGDPRREDVRAIVAECKRCRRITGGLLGFARASATRREAVALAELVDDTIASLGPQKLFKELEFACNPSTRQALRVIGDGDQLRQVLVNLLLNAGQAMGGAGTLRIEAFCDGRHAVILVDDSGPGVPEELREQIFEPFFSTKGRNEGTGLGLSVCRKLVEDHGGSLSVSTSSLGGARFRVELPLAH